MNPNIPTPKMDPLGVPKKRKMVIFSKTPLTVLIKFQKFKTAWVVCIFGKVMLGAKMCTCLQM
jgi:hypothetical protein